LHSSFCIPPFAFLLLHSSLSLSLLLYPKLLERFLLLHYLCHSLSKLANTVSQTLLLQTGHLGPKQPTVQHRLTVRRGGSRQIPSPQNCFGDFDL
jgi:hypothetical protein